MYKVATVQSDANRIIIFRGTRINTRIRTLCHIELVHVVVQYYKPESSHIATNHVANVRVHVITSVLLAT